MANLKMGTADFEFRIVNFDKELAKIKGLLNGSTRNIKLNNLKVGVDIDKAGLNKSLGDVSKQIKKTGKEIRKSIGAFALQEAIGGAGGSGIQGALGGYSFLGMRGAAIGGSIGLIKDITTFLQETLSISSKLRSTEGAYTALFKSQDKAREMLGIVNNLSLKNPLFNIADMRDTVKQLNIAGIEYKDLGKTLKIIGNVAPLVGIERMDNFVKALGDVKNNKILAGQEILQFSNANFPLLNILSDYKGVNVTKKNVSDLQITFEDIMGAMEKATGKGGQFFGMIDAMSNNSDAKLAMLSEQWYLFKEQIGEVLQPGAGTFIDALTSKLGGLTQKLKENPQALKQMADGLQKVAQASIVVANAILKITGAISSVINVATNLGPSIDSGITSSLRSVSGALPNFLTSGYGSPNTSKKGQQPIAGPRAPQKVVIVGATNPLNVNLPNSRTINNLNFNPLSI